MNSRGSILVLLATVMALLSILGATLLNVVLLNYRINKLNTESKKAFYLSENGLNESYIAARKLINEAIAYSLEKVEEEMLLHPLNEEEAKNFFSLNYKQYITVNVRNEISTTTNPAVEIRNDIIEFEDEELSLLLRSTYVSENNVVKVTWAELLIGVPDYILVKDGAGAGGDYVEFGKWGSRED